MKSRVIFVALVAFEKSSEAQGEQLIRRPLNGLNMRGLMLF